MLRPNSQAISESLKSQIRSLISFRGLEYKIHKIINKKLEKLLKFKNTYKLVITNSKTKSFN